MVFVFSIKMNKEGPWMKFLILKISYIDLSSKETSLIRNGNKKDTVSVTLAFLHNLKEYLSIRKVRYVGKDDENELVFIKLYKGEPPPSYQSCH